MRQLAALPLVLVLGLAAAACSRPWTVARTVVSSLAEGVHEGAEAAVDAYEASDCETTEDVEELRQCVQDLRAVAEARSTARAALLEGEALVDLWEQGGTEPGDWAAWAERTAQALARLVELLDRATVPIPEELTEAARVLDAYLEGRRGTP